MMDAPVEGAGRVPAIHPDRFRLFSLDGARLDDILAGAPHESDRSSAGAVVRLPLPDGRLSRFRVFESPVMVDSLAESVPWLRTYAGRGLDDPATSVRCVESVGSNSSAPIERDP